MGTLTAVRGEVISSGIRTAPGSSRRHPQDCRTVSEPNPGYEGFSVMFRFRCICGNVHSEQAFNVWPGNSNIQIVTTKCQTSNEPMEVELTKPESHPSEEDYKIYRLDIELKRLRQLAKP